MAEPAKHTTWERAQMAITAITGIVAILISLGQFNLTRQQQDLKVAQDSIASSLARIKSEQETVESISKYFDLLAGSDTSKAKMGAYAVYMLKREDPEMVVSLVLASGKPSLRNTVLSDLANRDAGIRKQLVAFASPQSDTATAAPEQQNVLAAEWAEAVLSNVSTDGWAYVGIHRDGRWMHGPMMDVGSRLPVPGQVYKVRARRLYLRDAAPDLTTNRHGSIQGLLNAEQGVRIEEVWQRPSRGHVWVRVTISDKASE